MVEAAGVELFSSSPPTFRPISSRSRPVDALKIAISGYVIGTQKRPDSFESMKSSLNRWWRRRESNPRPKARRRGTLHACPLLFSRARREKAAKNRQAPDPEHLTVARRAAAQPPACLMTFDPQPPGEAEANAHSLIRLRERTENPQLTDVPSDLRVNGARHAFLDSIPPSKPDRPRFEQ